MLGAVCQRLIVVSYCSPGSAHSQAEWAIWRKRSRAGTVRITEPSVRARSSHWSPSMTASMNSSVTRTELLAFWYWVEWLSTPSRSMSKPASRSTRALRSSMALHQMKSSTSGWSASRMTILAAARVLPPDLIVPAEASAPRMKLTGPEAVPPPLSSSCDERMRDRLTPAPEPPLKMIPSSVYQLRIESIWSSTERMKHADALLRHAVDADVEPHRRVERRPLVDDEVLQLVVEDLGLLVVDEVAVLDAPGGQRVRHPVGHLLQRPLALLGAERPPEVLLRQDVGGVDAPTLGHLDAQLLEGHRPVAVVGDAGVAPLPAHLVIGVDAGVVKWRRMPISDRWGAMAMVLGSSCVVRVGSGSLGGSLLNVCLGCSGAARPAMRRRHPTSVSGGSRALSSIRRPEEGLTRLTTICSGRPSPETRDAVSLHHCSYALVNQIPAPSVQVTGLHENFP